VANSWLVELIRSALGRLAAAAAERLAVPVRATRVAATLLAIAAVALPAALAPPGTGDDPTSWSVRILVWSGLACALLAEVFRIARLVTATGVAAVALTTIGLAGRRPPGSVLLTAVEAMVLGGYLLTAETGGLAWPPGALRRRLGSAGLVLLGSTAVVAGAIALPVAASAVVAVAGLAAAVGGYLLAVADRPRVRRPSGESRTRRTEADLD
jgi:hypothetical protein